jgi:hypothetical protein
MRVHPNRAAKPPCLDGSYLKRFKAPHRPRVASVFRTRPVPFSIAKPCGTHRLTSRIAGVEKTVQRLSLIAPQVTRAFKVKPLLRCFFPPNGDRVRQLARSPPGDGCLLQIMALVRQAKLPTSLLCSNLSAWPNLAPTCARLFLLERDGRF